MVVHTLGLYFVSSVRTLYPRASNAVVSPYSPPTTMPLPASPQSLQARVQNMPAS